MIGMNVGSVVAHLRLDSSQYEKALLTAQQRMNNFAASMGRMGSYLTLRLTLPIVYFGQKTVKAFAAFDDALTRSAAVTKGMTAEMRKQMGQTAIELSKKSLLSATELAEGYFALGQAGYSAAQSIKSLPVVEDFAIASSTNLDTAIRYLVRTVNGLGMASEDPIKNMEAMTRVSNAYTFAAITTTAEIEDFSVAMTHAAAPALRLVNKSIEEGISVLMAFASAGIQAEEAGTLLWTATRDLQRANIKARGEWKRLELSIYDTNGTMRNLADIFGDLEQRFMGMSDEGKKVNLMLLGFQDRSLRGIQALMGFSDQMKDWQEQMKKGGDLTKQIAEAYMKSFNAQLIMVRHNLNIVSISIGRILAPIIIRVNEKIKEFVTWWESLTEQTRLVIVEIAILAAIVGPLLIVLSKLVSTIVFLSIGFNVWIATTVKLVAALGLVSIEALAVVAVAGLLIAVAYSVRAAWNKGIGQIKDNLVLFADVFKLTYEYLGTVIQAFVPWFVESWHKMISQAKEDLSNFLKDAGGFARSITAIIKGEDPWAAFTEGREDAEIAVEKIKKVTIDAFDTAGTYAKAWAEAFAENAVALGKAIKEQFGEDIAVVTDLFVKKIKEMNEQFLGLLPSEVEQRMIDFVTKTKELKTGFDDTSSGVLGLEKILKDLYKDLKVQYDLIGKTIKEQERYNAIIHLRTIFEEKLGDIINWTTEEQEQYNKELDKYIENLDLIIAKRESFAAFFESTRQWIEDAGYLWKNLGDDMARGLDSFADTLADFMVQGKADWKAFTASILQDWLRTILRMQIATLLKPEAEGGFNLIGAIVSGLSGAFNPAVNVGSGTMGTGAGGASMTGTTVVAALGKVFNHGQIIPMAMGDVIGSPSFMPLSQNRTTLIGEAGPEAVMPLTRDSSGRLGVRSEQPQVNVNNRMKIVNVLDPDEVLAAMRTTAGEKLVLNIMHRNGIG